MSDLIVIQPQVTELTVTEQVNQVTVSSVGVQGAKGDTGAQGTSGVVSVTAPITNSGTSTAANIGVSAGSTSAAGVLQLTDSTSSTSTTTAATPAAVKSAYDLALINPVLKQQSGTYRRTASQQDSSQSVSNNRIYYTPIFVDSTTSFDRLAMRTGTTFSGTSTVRLGIFANSDGLPSTLILDAGTVTATAATTIYQITISQSLDTGFYWLAFAQQGTAPTTAVYFGAASSGTFAQNGYMMNQATPSSILYNGYFESSSGAFSNASSLTGTASVPYTWIRAS